MLMALLGLTMAGATMKLEIECFADRPTLFQRGSLTQLAEQEGTRIVTYRLEERAEIETRLSQGLGVDPTQAVSIINRRLAANPRWLENLTHSATGQNRALALGIKEFPAIVIDGQIYHTDHIDQAIREHRKNAR